MPIHGLLSILKFAAGKREATPPPTWTAGDYAQLEHRVVYSSVPLGILTDFEIDTPFVDADEVQEIMDAAPPEGVWEDSWADWSGLPELRSGDFEDLASKELVFVDAGTENYERLLTELLSAGQRRNFEVVMLNSDADGIEQITSALEHQSGLDAIHVISHGRNGEVQLGDGFLNASSLKAHALDVASWGDSLDVGGDILFYGCDLASGNQGIELLEAIQELTQADVAASEDATGHRELGGDWEFEYIAGAVETDVALSFEIQADWTHTLAAAVAEVGETAVNTDPSLPAGQRESTGKTGRGSDSAVGIADNGDYVVVWSGGSGDSVQSEDIYAQRFDKFGETLGSAVLVNQHLPNSQDDASVAVHPDGHFVVIWESTGQDYTDSSNGIYFRMFGADGLPFGNATNPSGDEVLVNSFVVDDQSNPDVAMNDAGEFVIGWQGEGSSGFGVYARTFDADGTPAVDQFFIDASTTVNPSPSVGIDGAGEVVIAWNDTASETFKLARHDFLGNVLVSPTLGPVTAGVVQAGFANVSIDTREDGLTAVAATADQQFNVNDNVHVTVYDEDLNAEPAPSLTPFVNESSLSSQLFPSVAFTDDGWIYAVWEGEGNAYTDHSDDYGVFGRRLEVQLGSGLPQLVLNAGDSEFRINETTDQTQEFASVASLNKDTSVVVWSGNGQGDSDGVFFRAYGNPPPQANSETGDTNEDTSTLIDVFANDSDLLLSHETTAETLTLSGVTLTGALGSLTHTGNGILSFDPSGAFESLADLATAHVNYTYTLVDSLGSTSTASNSITVNGVNDAPVANNDSYLVGEANTLNIVASDSNSPLANDLDVDTPHATLTVSVVSDVANGSLNLDPDGAFRYTPDLGFFGSDSFVYRVDDGNGGTDTATATIAVERATHSGQTLLFSLDNDVSVTAPSLTGVGSLQNENLAALGDPGFALSTAGTVEGELQVVLDAEPNPTSSPTDIAAAHVVRDDILIGGSSQSQIQVLAGDVLFVADGSNVLGTTSAKSDLLGYRPATDTYFEVFNSPFSVDVNAITLVETDGVMIDGTQLSRGTLLASFAGQERQVWFYRDMPTGWTTAGRLLDLRSTFTSEIDGLELIERETTIGGVTLSRESLLTSLSGTETLAGVGTVDPGDIIALDLDPATGNVAAISLVFDDDVVNLSGEDVNAVAIISQVNPFSSSFVPDQQLTSVDEHNGAYSDTIAVQNPTGVLLQFDIVNGNDDGIFAIDNSGVITVADAEKLDFEVASSHVLEVRVTEGAGGTHSGFVTIDVNDVAEASISGNIYEDVVGDGSVSADPTVEAVAVHLYRDNGDGLADASDVFIASTTTLADGSYSFSELRAGTYWVAVDSKTVTKQASSLNAPELSDDIWAEQTYGTSGALVTDGNGGVRTLVTAGTAFGGRHATLADHATRTVGMSTADASPLASSEHLHQITLLDAEQRIGVDYGFSFNVVTNALDGLTPELVKNGNFDSGLTDWDLINPTGGTQPSIISGAVALNSSNEAVGGDGISQVIATGIGEAYTLSLELSENGSFNHSHYVFIEVLDDSSNTIVSQAILVQNDASGIPVEIGFVAASNQTTIRLTNPTSSGTVNSDVWIDNVSVVSTTVTDRTIQGSLRQFLQNASAIVNANEMRFVPVQVATDTDGASSWWSVDVSVELAKLDDPGTTVDGAAFDFTDGVSLRNANVTQVGSLQAVGLGDDAIAASGDEPALTGVAGPELAIAAELSSNLPWGLLVDADDVTLANLAIYGFGDGTADSANVWIEGSGGTVSGFALRNSILGAGPTADSDAISTSGALGGNSHNLVADAVVQATIEDSVIVRAARSGIRARAGSTGWTITGNEIRSNAAIFSFEDGVNFNNAGNSIVTTIQDNLITETGGRGIDLLRSEGNFLIKSNTIALSGQLTAEAGGIRVYGSGSTITENVIHGNAGDGVHVVGRIGSSPAAINNEITRNSFSGNGGIAIDIAGNNANSAIGDGISINDGLTFTNSGNLGLDYPGGTSGVITFNTQTNSYSGFDISANSRIELYLAAAIDDSDQASGIYYGEGLTYLQTWAPGRPPIVLGDTGIIPSADDELTLLNFDANGNTSEFSPNIEINFAPVANDDIVVLQTNSSFTASWEVLVSNDTDEDDHTVLLRLVSGPAEGVLVDNGSTFTYTPNLNFAGTDSFVYEIEDSAGATDQATVVISVGGINTSPVANPDTYEVNEDEVLTSTLGTDDLLFNDTDVDGDTLTVNGNAASEPSNGTLTLNGDGTFVYTPAEDFNGTDTFSYEVSDGNGGVSFATATITVLPVNDAPTAAPDSYSTDEDTVLEVTLGDQHLLLNDSDIENDPLVVLINPAVDPAGTVDLRADGTFTYTPAADFNGIDTFSYEVSDGNGGVSVATATITVSPLNDAPTAAPDSYSTDEDTVLEVTLGDQHLLFNDSDIENDPLVVLINPAVDPAGTVDLRADGTFTYTPAQDFHGIDSFHYTVTDLNGGSAIGVVTITVGPVNDSPVAAPDEVNTDEDVIVIGNFLANDSDVESDAISLVAAPLNGPSHGSVIVQPDGTFEYTPGADFFGSDSFQYQISDTNLGSATGLVTINVDAVNDAPTAAPDSYSTDEDTVLEVTLGDQHLLFNDSDIENDPLVVLISPAVDPAGTVDLRADGTFTYTPVQDFHGIDSFHYTVTDLNGGSAIGVVTITVGPVDDSPVAVNDSLTVDEDTTFTSTQGVDDLLANDFDADMDGLTVIETPEVAPTNGSVTISFDGSYTYTPFANFHGTDSFVYRVTDGTYDAVATVDIVVVSTNDVPTVTLVSELPVAWGSSASIEELNLIVEDADHSSAELMFTVSGLLHGHVAFVDDPGNPITTFTQADVEADRVLYVHTGAEAASDELAFVAADPLGASVSGILEINLGPAPIAVQDLYETTPGQLLVVSDPGVLGNDDGRVASTTTLALIPPTNGELLWNVDGTFSYRPEPGFVGTDSFTYLVESIFGQDTATVQINVFPVNQGGGTTDNPNDTGNIPLPVDSLGAPPVNAPTQVSETEKGSGDEKLSRNDHANYSSQLDFVTTDSKSLASIGASVGVRASRYESMIESAQVAFETGTFDVSAGVVDTSFDMSSFSGSLDQFHDSYLSAVTVGDWGGAGGIAIAGSLSIGWVIVSLKGGYIVGSLLSATTPTWAMIDPLPVFDSLGNEEKEKNGERDLLDELLGSTASRVRP